MTMKNLFQCFNIGKKEVREERHQQFKLHYKREGNRSKCVRGRNKMVGGNKNKPLDEYIWSGSFLISNRALNVTGLQ